MSQVGLKKVLIYKSHLFPELKKPIRQIRQLLMVKNPDLSIIKAKKMAKILDEDEKRRLKIQRQVYNDKINNDLQAYYYKFIQPFKKCPDFFKMLFKYSINKMDMIYKTRKQMIQGHYSMSREKPFLLQLSQINKINKLIKDEYEQKLEKIQQHIKQEGQQNKRTQKQQKLLFQIYQNLCPFQKSEIYRIFQLLYRNFLIDNGQVSQMIKKGQITRVKPFIIYSPEQYVQSMRNYYQYSIPQCSQLFQNNPKLKDKYCKLFKKTVQKRGKQIQFLEDKYNLSFKNILTEFRKQYCEIDRMQNFYEILKN